MAVLAKILLDEAPPLRVLRPDASIELDNVVRRALAKRPEERPTNGTALAELLGRCLEPGHAGAVLPVKEPTPALRERRLVCVVLTSDQSHDDRTITPAEQSAQLEKLRAVVDGNGGTLARLGPNDLIVTVESSGVATDQATRAARCALALASALSTVDVALAMGWAELGPIPVGEVIDRAAGLLKLRPGSGGVRVDEVSAGLLDVRFEIVALEGQLRLREERELDSAPRTLLGRPTKCVGRAREITTLTAIYEEVQSEGVARAALVTGVAGAGKSRVRHELLERVRTHDARPAVWLARGEALRSGSPLDLLAGCVRAGTALREGEPLEAARDHLRARVRMRISPSRSGSLGSPQEVAELLGEIVGVPFPDSESPRLAAARRDARMMGEQMLAAWLSLLEAECDVRPVVLVLEDLHWGDPQTVRFIDVALRELANKPIFVLAVARPEIHDRFPSLWRDRAISEVRLAGLSARACTELARQVLDDAAPELIARIVQHTEGNALYVEEMIREAAHGTVDTLPASVLAMVQSRLEALDAHARRFLRAASVFGEVFRADGALAIADASGIDAPQIVLSRLVESEVVTRRSGGHAGLAGEYAFRHALVREAAYAMLSDEERTRAHARAARWLEQAGEKDGLLLAQHHDRGGEPGRAARWWGVAARQALDRNDFEAALVRAQWAMDRSSEPGIVVEARAVRGRACACLGRWADAQAEADAALAIASEPSVRLDLLRDLWNVGVFRQDSATLRRVGGEAMQLATARGEGELLAEAQCALAFAEHLDARVDEGVRQFRIAANASAEKPSHILGISTVMLYHAGLHEEAETWIRRVLVRAEDVRDWQTVCFLYANLGLVLSAQGRYGEAREAYGSARATAERCGLVTALARTVSITAGHHLDVYDWDGAERHAREACNVGRNLEFTTPRVSATLDLVAIAIRKGDPDEATSIADSIADPVARGTGFHGWLWRARMSLLRAEIMTARHDWEGAIHQSRDAIAQATSVRRLKYRISGQILLARALAEVGDRTTARSEIDDALSAARASPDPAQRLRVGLAAMALGRDESILAETLEQAEQIERGLPDQTSRAMFRSAPELHILG
jgi:tetratricopeptide (TPR) repeat protein